MSNIFPRVAITVILASTCGLVTFAASAQNPTMTPVDSAMSSAVSQASQCYTYRDRYGRIHQHCNNTPTCTYDKYGNVIGCVG
jgi:FlaG/FlaF family flagellin (archaellin)